MGQTTTFVACAQLGDIDSVFDVQYNKSTIEN